MCYAKPGPRCAAHAWKRVQTVAENASGRYSQDDLENAQLDYYSTKAGLAYLELRILQNQDTTDLIKSYRRVNVSEYKAAAEAWHAKKMEAYKQEHGDGEELDHAEQNFECDHFEPLSYDSDGTLTPEMLEAYKNESLEALHHIPDDTYTNVIWYTSDGSTVMNDYIHNGYQLEGTKYEDTVSEENLKERMNGLSRAIQSSKREKHIRLYRGVNNAIFDSMINDTEYGEHHHDTERLVELASERFKPGSTFMLPNFASTSYEPVMADRFTSSTNIMFEMDTKTALPVGALSAWGTVEKEYIVDRDTQFEVISVDRKQLYKGSDEHLVIKLREI